MLRVVQWTTGRTGREAVRGVVGHPELELVGCFAWSSDKRGRDVGELCGIDPLGIVATDDIDALLELEPDCIVYTPFRPNIDHVERILVAGCNVVTTMYQLAGSGYGSDVAARIHDATMRGGASLYASGIYPGHVPMMALAATAVSARIERITMLESVDMSTYANESMFRAMGIDRDPADAEAATLAERSCASFRDQVAALGRAHGLALDEIRFTAEFAVAPRDLDFGFMTIGAGESQPSAGSSPEPLAAGHGSSVARCGRWASTPSRTGRSSTATPSRSWAIRRSSCASTGEGWTGAASTAMPVVNAIPQVCAARPGILEPGDLPLIRGAGASL
jgi:hypothetical protein